MKRFLILLAFIFVSAFSASAQLRAYTFQYNDEFGGKQKCYATLRSIVAEWDQNRLDVLFNCYESAAIRAKNVEPRKILLLSLTGADFAQNVLKPITAGDKDKPLAVLLSESAWTIAENYKFIDDFAYDDQKKQMVATKKSLTDLNAVKVDVPLQ